MNQQLIRKVQKMQQEMMAAQKKSKKRYLRKRPGP